MLAFVAVHRPDQAWADPVGTSALIRRAAFAVVVCVTLAGCADFPDVASFSPDDGTFPALQPLDDLLARQGSTVSDPGPELAVRAARLKARAATASPG